MRFARFRLRGRTIAAVLLAVALVALGAGLFLIDQIGEAIISRRQADVAQSARDYFVAFAREEGLSPLARALDLRERTGNHDVFRYALFSDSGALIGGARLTALDRLPSHGQGRIGIGTSNSDSQWQVLVQHLQTGGTLVVYEDLADRSAFRQALVQGGAFALLAALGAVLTASLWLNQLIYRRALAIERTASNIASGDLSARAPSEANGDVFDKLGNAINIMLDRNEELLIGLRTVTDSLAHDLRSPLSRLKSALATALDPDVRDSVRDEAIGSAWDEADIALSTTSALLDIARAETGLSRELFQTIDLVKLVTDIAELFEPVLEDASQSLQVRNSSSALYITGHELLLRQAVGNLLFNASRYAGAGAEVLICTVPTATGARLILADTGPGIPESDRGRVLERFVRLDSARTSHGSGLGLAIAAACAKLHGGTLILEDNDPGLRVIMTLGGGL